MTFADRIRSILGVLLIGVGLIALAEEYLFIQHERKTGFDPHDWWYHPGTRLLIAAIFVMGARLFYVSLVRPLVRGRGLRAVREYE
jgi:hypothetical protein